jgi:hypothetical protein
MGTLAFTDDFRLFDGHCVRFRGYDGKRPVMCGVTCYALKHHVPGLPTEGLLPAEMFLEAYDRLMTEIHAAARRKYAAGKLEPDNEVEIMVHAKDWPE